MIKSDTIEITSTKVHKVLDVRTLTSSAYILVLERGGLSFQPGQHLILGLENNPLKRQYSIYSGIQDNFIEVLIREVDNGELSRQFKLIKPGERIIIEGPYGDFMLNDEQKNKKLLFIATGTGISPFHSMIKSYPDLDYTLLHGVKQCNEMFDKNDYATSKYIPCVSNESCDAFLGRVTDFIKQNPLNGYTAAYLCGNSHMIYDANLILKNKGFTWGNIFVEVYF